MTLPKLTTVTHELEVPSTKEKLKFRPFLVKEQKVLMIAQQTEDLATIQNAIADVISTCTFGKMDPWQIPSFDLEYVFLHIRAKSVGEELELNILCPDDLETRVPIKINLEDIKVNMVEDHTSIIEINDQVKVVMKYPTMKEITQITTSDSNDVDQLFAMVRTCVSEVHDGETIYKDVDITNDELEEFIGSMQAKDLEKINLFFETMPKLFHTIKVENPNTKVESEVTLEGFDDFFE